ncbi:MAG: hypothetical protein K2J58_00925 [Muribaculaceae bacterium]|nr:hypothetical protein [Muribaculaceae bacterium]
MNKFLLLASLTALGLSAIAAEIPDPKVILNSNAYYMSPNAQYMVSDGYVGLQIFDLISGQSYDYTEDSPVGHYEASIGRCISDNGIVLSLSGEYWMDAKWTALKVPSNSRYGCLGSSITPDGRRICGIIGMSGMNTDDSDNLRDAPFIWDWDESKGSFGQPVKLPYPDKDFTGRTPQMVTAIDISADGKTVVGQVMTALGNIQYPIIYREDVDGEWSYEIPDRNSLYPEGYVFPEYPTDNAPTMPSYETYMSQEQLIAYIEAYNEYINSGYVIPEPQYQDYMTSSEIEEYEKAMADYTDEYKDWSTKFNAWISAYYRIASSIPEFQFNSIRISPDGKTYANTVLVEEEIENTGFFRQLSYIYVFDIETGAVTKYEQKDNFVLTYLGNDGTVLAVTNLLGEPQSYVLTNGECIDMRTWITTRIPQYDAWMEENMLQGIEVSEFDPDLGEEVITYKEMVLTGRASATPDLSVVMLGVTNVWDYLDEGISYLFDMTDCMGVSNIRPVDGESFIYDLHGRRLKNAEAPGIYIINGKKKAVR